MTDAAVADRAAARRAAARDRRRARQLRWFVPLGALLVRALGRTWRVSAHGQEASDAVRRGGTPVIYAFWHGEMLPLMVSRHDDGITVLISEHHDGEILARISERFGYGTVRGSTSRGGARALLELVKLLEGGRTLGVTPDGPRGPAHRFAPGALVAAQRAGVPIVPVAVRASRAWRLSSWDRFMIPKPFARVVIAYGEPAAVRGTTPREATEDAARFERLLTDAAVMADRAMGEG